MIEVVLKMIRVFLLVFVFSKIVLSNPTYIQPEIYKITNIKEAIYYHDLDKLKYFIKKGEVNSIKPPDYLCLAKCKDTRTTPLMLAVSDPKFFWAIDILLDSGADPNLKNSFGLTALHYAIINLAFNPENNFILKKLIKVGANINDLDHTSSSAIFYAIEYGVYSNPKLIQVLLDNGADTKITNHSGQTPLSLAERIGAEKIIKMIKRKRN